MKELSRIATEVRASTTLAVDSLAKQMKAEGKDVIGFGTGEPDFDTPENMRPARLNTPPQQVCPICARLFAAA